MILTKVLCSDIIFSKRRKTVKINKIFANVILCCALLVCFAFTGCVNKPKTEETFSDDPIFKAENWKYMTNNNGAVQDSGGVPYSLDDGTIKFHNANQAYDYGSDLSNGSVEFMLKGSKNWQMWFLADTVDNTAVNCYKMIYKDGELYLTTSETLSALASVSAKNTKYTENDWNKFEIAFSTESNVCEIKLTVNDEHVVFDGKPVLENATVSGGNLLHTRSQSFKTGNYICVKVWYGDCFLQLRSVEDAGKSEVNKIACMGDSITYGANADNSYTDSYPAQLQKLYGGRYNVMNFGKSGATARDSADDPYRKTDEYKGAMLFKPDIAIIMLGSNDSKTYQVPTEQAMVDALGALIDDVRNLNSQTEIFIATSPYAYSTAYQISNSNIENIVIPAQRDVVNIYGVKLIDMHEYTKNMNGNYADGIHPTTKGYTYISYCFYCELEGIEPDTEYMNTFKD